MINADNFIAKKSPQHSRRNLPVNKTTELLANRTGSDQVGGPHHWSTLLLN